MPILIVGALLLFFGILAMFSVSIYDSFALGLRSIANGNVDVDPTNYFYFFKQLRNIVIGVCMALVVYKIPIKLFQRDKTIYIIF